LKNENKKFKQLGFCSANQLKIEPLNSVISNPRGSEKSRCKRAVPDFSPAKRDRNDIYNFSMYYQLLILFNYWITC